MISILSIKFKTDKKTTDGFKEMKERDGCISCTACPLNNEELFASNCLARDTRPSIEFLRRIVGYDNSEIRDYFVKKYLEKSSVSIEEFEV